MSDGWSGARLRALPLPITHYPLPITHYPLPITHYPLPINHHPPLRPEHQAELERMGELGVARIRADAVLEMAAEIRRELELEAMLAGLGHRAGGGKLVAHVVARALQKQLDDHVVRREAV